MYEARMSEIGRNGTRGNESDCARAFQRAFPSRLKKRETGEEREEERERRARSRQREDARGKKEVARGGAIRE